MIEDTLDSPYIRSASNDDFFAMVLENSRNGPVLANFWSQKAGPCLRQYPLLDKLIYHYGGRLLLVNIDADTEIKLSHEYGIASVPTLKLFRHAQIVETLYGYQTEADLQHMLDQYVARESDQQLAQAIKHYAQAEHDQAYAMISEAIVNDPLNPRLPLALCKLLKHEQRYQDAINLISTLPANLAAHKDLIKLQHQLEFLSIAANGSNTEQNTAILEQQAVESKDYLELKKQLSAHYVVQQNYQQALATLVTIMEMDQNFDDQYARKAMLKIFILLGNEHNLISRYRPLLRRYN